MDQTETLCWYLLFWLNVFVFAVLNQTESLCVFSVLGQTEPLCWLFWIKVCVFVIVSDELSLCICFSDQYLCRSLFRGST